MGLPEETGAILIFEYITARILSHYLRHVVKFVVKNDFNIARRFS